MPRPPLALLPATVLLAAASLAAQPGAQEAGRIVSMQGGVDLTAADGSPRHAMRGALLYAGDTLSIEAGGQAQLRMRDDTLLSVHNGTVLRLSAVGAGGPGASFPARYELKQGGFRAVSGERGIRMESSHASIEAEPGGNFQCRLESELYCGSTSLSVKLHNTAGSLTLGLGGDYDYGLVATPASAPLGLLDLPEALGGTLAPQPVSPLNRSVPPPSPPNASPRTVSGGFPPPAPIVITPEKKRD